jgi:hypothetical protein
MTGIMSISSTPRACRTASARCSTAASGPASTHSPHSSPTAGTGVWWSPGRPRGPRRRGRPGGRSGDKVRAGCAAGGGTGRRRRVAAGRQDGRAARRGLPPRGGDARGADRGRGLVAAHDAGRPHPAPPARLRRAPRQHGVARGLSPATCSSSTIARGSSASCAAPTT